jgi:hypothetical protein
MVIADHGPLALLAAAQLALFYLREGLDGARRGEHAAASTCGERALALTAAVDAAVEWRRAAGWSDPFAADGLTLGGQGPRA